MKKRWNNLRIEVANSLTEPINNTDDGRKMFEAVRQLSGNKKSDSISVFNDKNQLENNESDKADIIRNYFELHYTGPDSKPPLEPFFGSPQPLNNPITSFEVQQAAKKLRNGKAVGPDSIPNEFLKHSPPIFYSLYLHS